METLAFVLATAGIIVSLINVLVFVDTNKQQKIINELFIELTNANRELDATKEELYKIKFRRSLKKLEFTEEQK